MPQSDRVNSGYVLDVGGRLIQIDCGGGVSAAFRRAGFDPLDVERVVISHTHADHISDLPLFIQMQYLAGRREPIHVHLPQEAIAAVGDYCRALYLLPEKLPFAVDFLPVTAGSVMEVPPLTMLPIWNRHLNGYAPFVSEFGPANRMQCYSYLFRADGKTVLYSADLGSEEELFPYLSGIDLLVVESTHIDLERLLAETVRRGVKRVALTHFTEEFDIGQATVLARKAGAEGFLIAEDGMRIDL